MLKPGKIVSIFLSIFVVLLLLPGCEQLLAQLPFVKSTQNPPTTATALIPTIQFPTENVATPAEILPTEITLWLPPQFDPGNGSTAGNLLKKQLEKFSSDFPKVKLLVRIKAVNGSGGLLDSLTTTSEAAPAALPGIILLPRADFETAAEDGLLIPVEPTDFKLEDADTFDYAREITRVKEIRYGLPFSGDLLVFAYKPLQIGFPPHFWDGLFQQKSIVSFPAADSKALSLIALYINAGGTFEINDEKVFLKQTALQNSLKIISDGVSTNIFPYWLVDISSFEQSLKELSDSRATYSIIWASQVLTETTDKISFTTIPTLTEDQLTVADGWVLAFPQTSPERYADHLRLAEYLLDPAFQQEWSEEAGVVPVSKAVLANWNNVKVSGILLDIADTARLIPSNTILEKLGPLLSVYTQELLQNKVNYIEASNKIIEEISK